MGTIYAGRRDPKPLFQALSEVGFDPKDVRVQFYGNGLDIIRDQADRLGVKDFVEIYPPVPYDDSVDTQRRADVLLLLQWNDPREQGNVPAKLFEYLAVRRPILSIGLMMVFRPASLERCGLVKSVTNQENSALLKGTHR